MFTNVSEVLAASIIRAHHNPENSHLQDKATDGMINTDSEDGLDAEFAISQRSLLSRSDS
jgi:hypothetical protein